MTYGEAWDVLVANKISPVRNARITLMGTEANYRSKKGRLIRGLQIVGFAAAVAGGILANNGELTDLQLTALLAGPKAAEAGIQFFSGAPNEWQETPSEAGFVTIYSLYSNVLIAEAQTPAPALASPPTPVPAPATSHPGFVPTSWHALLVETRPDVDRVRQADIAWSREWAIAEAQGHMNQAEAELLAGVR